MSRFNVERFINAQNNPYASYEQALAEIRQGRETGHWIWYVFPQMKGHGFSYNSQYYGISSEEEALEYIHNEVLHSRLIEITSALLSHKDKSAVDILGHTDAMKLKSSMTLFDAVCPNDVFAEVLSHFFSGRRCERTLRMLQKA